VRWREALAGARWRGALDQAAESGFGMALLGIGDPPYARFGRGYVSVEWN